jgi:hypothetical protein
LNSTIKTAAKVAEELSQSNKNSDTKQERISKRVRQGEYLKGKKTKKNKAKHG